MLTCVNIYGSMILTGINIMLSCVNIVCKIHLFKKTWVEIRVEHFRKAEL